ncbi:hypothetical protein FEM48_Zijuj08G0106100 [Ziziphus jujuba var. spinosa]|uniref:Calcium uniporter protein C-terminal domain-containing protein n=1 Tax=Ziziphus jujuba var. spinosa TaxID=714518 RepID=A0A978UYL5_ZIZJJ|nr:hypothetical protein FEM48_Zijuj08G0106100 [Ziziphus jujuba var. spinosa]
MAFKKTLAQRLFNISKITNSRISSSSTQTRIPPNPNRTKIAPDPGDNGIFRRFLHKRAILQPSLSTEIRSLPIGENLMNKLKSIGIAQDRIRLEVLTPPPPPPPVEEASAMVRSGLRVEDAKKLLSVAQLEAVKSRLREIQNSWIPFSDFVRICGESCSDLEEGRRLARKLDESGSVIVLGNVVFLKPEQIAKAIQELIPIPQANLNDPRRKELEEMEKQKAEIDKKAKSLVRRELWGGLGFLVVQTAGFMRLTFWELSWDVMEPICFYVTSTYFMAGYAFFLRTSIEPSFEGFYHSRFSAKQRKLMKLHNFDIGRYNQLKKAFHPYPSTSSLDGSEKLQFGVIHQ